MTFFSYKVLAFAWTGLAGAAAIGAGALQASYVAPAPPVAAATPATPPQADTAPALPPPMPPVPFENRSLLAMLPPPGIRPHPAARPAAAESLPVPPVPPMRVARVDAPRRAIPHSAPEPNYGAEPPDYAGWGWGRPLPYPGRYASGRSYYYAGPPGYNGW